MDGRMNGTDVHAVVSRFAAHDVRPLDADVAAISGTQERRAAYLASARPTIAGRDSGELASRGVRRAVAIGKGPGEEPGTTSAERDNERRERRVPIAGTGTRYRIRRTGNGDSRRRRDVTLSLTCSRVRGHFSLATARRRPRRTAATSPSRQRVSKTFAFKFTLRCQWRSRATPRFP